MIDTPGGYALTTPLINVMVSAARKAARGLMRDFSEVDHLQISKKGAVNFVTEADIRAEQTIKAELMKARPKWGYLMEESGESAGEDTSMRWVVDPLDGTNNFIHAVPYFCISIAAEKTTEYGTEIVAGVIYDPVHDEMFMAEVGKGAFVNHRKLKVANQRDCDFYFVTGTSRMPNPYNDVTSELTRQASKMDCVIRRGGAAALDLAFVAAGRYDACWFAKLQKWDMAAGILLVKEAGGVIASPAEGVDPYESGCIIAATHPAYRIVTDSSRQQNTAIA